MRIKKFQEGGMVPAEEGAPMEAQPQEGMPQGGLGGGNPEEQLVQLAQEIISQMGPEAAMMLAQIIMEMVQGGGQPQEQPVFAKRGAKIMRLS